jgi:predicted acetyltransferase
MQFNKSFGNRRVTINRANKKDLKSYKIQLVTHNTTQDEALNIFRSSEDHQYLAIKDSSSKLIGIIQIDEESCSTTINVKISIPNESWRMKYGTEALHQFVKYCQENKLYSYIYFKTNEIVKEYKSERPEMFVKNSYIQIA